MLSSTGSEESHYNSSSWSSSTTTTPRRTMEEVWKDINLASLSDPDNTLNNNPNFRNMTLQNFLARPFGNVVSPTPDHHHHHPVLTSPTPPPPPHEALMPTPTTVLNLNRLNSDQFQLFCIENLNTRPIVNINHPNSTTVSDNSFSGAYSFEGLGDQISPPPGVVLPSGFGVGKKRVDHGNFGGGDRRHKRMIMNREAAARSRARKQAYTNEMELEVHRLNEENAELRRRMEELSKAAASQQPKRHSLHRTSTAPF